MRKSFILHTDSLEILRELTDEQAGKLFKAIYEHNAGNDVELDAVTKMCFLPFRNQFKRDLEAYNEVCEKNKINGSKGGRPKKSEDNPKNPSAFLETQKTQPNPKNLDSDNDSKNDSDSKSKKEILDFSFVNEKLIDDFKAFVEYRKSIKKPIKTQDQLQRIYNQLKKYSKVDAVVAKEIINRSIVNGWQGLFELPQVKQTEQPKTLSRYTMNAEPPYTQLFNPNKE